MRVFDVDAALFLLFSAQWTIYLSLMTFVTGGIVAVLLVAMMVSERRVIRLAPSIYLQVFQNTPLLIQLFIAYFGLSLIGYRLPPIFAAAIALTFFASAYLSQIWFGAIQSVPKAQYEASTSLALTKRQSFQHVVVPQAIKIATPATVGFFVQVVKNTSLTSIVGMTELMRAASMMNNATLMPTKVFGTVCLIYFAICYPISLLSRYLEGKQRGHR